MSSSALWASPFLCKQLSAPSVVHSFYRKFSSKPPQYSHSPTPPFLNVSPAQSPTSEPSSSSSSRTLLKPGHAPVQVRNPSSPLLSPVVDLRKIWSDLSMSLLSPRSLDTSDVFMWLDIPYHTISTSTTASPVPPQPPPPRPVPSPFSISSSLSSIGLTLASSSLPSSSTFSSSVVSSISSTVASLSSQLWPSRPNSAPFPSHSSPPSSSSSVPSSSGSSSAETASVSMSLDPKHHLDVFSPKKALHSGLPVVVFVHGGSWQSGDRRHMFHIYSNVGVALAKHHIVTAVISYRLSPAVKYPLHVFDFLHSVKWVSANIHRFGGDPSQLFFAGHSAGAHIALSALTRLDWMTGICQTDRQALLNSIKGFVGISGVYNVLRLVSLPFAPAWYEPVFGLPVTSPAAAPADVPHTPISGMGQSNCASPLLNSLNQGHHHPPAHIDPTSDAFLAHFKAASPVHNFTSPLSIVPQIPLLLINSDEDFYLKEDTQEVCDILSKFHSSSASSSSSSSSPLPSKPPQVSTFVTPKTNHMTVISSVGQKDDKTTKQMVDFIQRVSCHR
eukprot:GILI01023844.1.p1 GENE.GILI01023844.1~~GILI01023844.1.p1  ORF type:complete len:558 (+),score=112.14 GILI01023844.1:61-1734(+)